MKLALLTVGRMIAVTIMCLPAISMAQRYRPILEQLDPDLQQKFNSSEAKVKEAAFDLDLANKRLKSIQDGLEDKAKKAPDWIAASSKLDAAKGALANANKTAVDSIATNPDFVSAQSKFDSIQSAIDQAKSGGDGPDVIAPLAMERVSAAAKLNKLKTDCVEKDPVVLSCKKTLAEAQQAMDQLRNNFVSSLAANPAWSSASESADQKKSQWVTASAERDAARDVLNADKASKEERYQQRLVQYNDEINQDRASEAQQFRGKSTTN